MNDAHNETLNAGHDDNEETNLDQDDYELDIKEDTNVIEDKEDDDNIYSFLS